MAILDFVAARGIHASQTHLVPFGLIIFKTKEINDLVYTSIYA